MIGYALCGSFCTLSRSVEILTQLKEKGYDILPIMSEITATTNTRFGKAADFTDRRWHPKNQLTQRDTSSVPRCARSSSS